MSFLLIGNDRKIYTKNSLVDNKRFDLNDNYINKITFINRKLCSMCMYVSDKLQISLKRNIFF